MSVMSKDYEEYMPDSANISKESQGKYISLPKKELSVEEIEIQIKDLEQRTQLLRATRPFALEWLLLQLLIGIGLLVVSLSIMLGSEWGVSITAKLPGLSIQLAGFLFAITLYWLYLTYLKLKFFFLRTRKIHTVRAKSQEVINTAKQLLTEHEYKLLK